MIFDIGFDLYKRYQEKGIDYLEALIKRKLLRIFLEIEAHFSELELSKKPNTIDTAYLLKNAETIDKIEWILGQQQNFKQKNN